MVNVVVPRRIGICGTTQRLRLALRRATHSAQISSSSSSSSHVSIVSASSSLVGASDVHSCSPCVRLPLPFRLARRGLRCVFAQGGFTPRARKAQSIAVERVDTYTRAYGNHLCTCGEREGRERGWCEESRVRGEQGMREREQGMGEREQGMGGREQDMGGREQGMGEREDAPARGGEGN